MTREQGWSRPRHELTCYGSDEQYLEVTVPFACDGLEQGEHVLVITTSRNIVLLRDALGPSAAMVRFVDSERWYQAPARTMFAYYSYVDTRQRDGQVRIIGEPNWQGRSPAELLEWARCESIFNVMFASTDGWLRCLFNTQSLPADVIDLAGRTHPGVVGQPNGNPSFVPPEQFDGQCSRAPLPDPDGAVETFWFRQEKLSAMREFVSDFGMRSGLPAERGSELVLVVNEIATNAVRYGGGQGWLRVWDEPAGVVCEVVDIGGMFPDPFVGYLPPPPTSEHGWGLWVTRQLCELVEIRHRTPDVPGVVVRLHLRRAAA